MDQYSESNSFNQNNDKSFFRSFIFPSIAFLFLMSVFFFGLPQQILAQTLTTGFYTNLCGSVPGFPGSQTYNDANSPNCSQASCSPSTGTCTASQGQWIARFECNGMLSVCENDPFFRFGNPSENVTQPFPVACDKTVQIDVFSKACTDGSSPWVCSDADVLGFMVWYSGNQSTGRTDCGITPTPTLTPTPLPGTPTPVPQNPTLSLKIIQGFGGIVGPTYGLTGLRSDDPKLTAHGNNTFNAFRIKPDVSTNIPDSDIELVGVAFTSQSAPPPAAPLSPVNISTNLLGKLLQSADYGNGFVVVYSSFNGGTNGDKTYPSGPPVGTDPNCSTNFCQNTYYGYYGGVWKNISSSAINFLRFGNSALQMLIFDPIGKPRNPRFDLKPFQSLGNRKWDTFTYVGFRNLEQYQKTRACNDDGTSCTTN